MTILRKLTDDSQSNRYRKFILLFAGIIFVPLAIYSQLIKSPEPRQKFFDISNSSSVWGDSPEIQLKQIMTIGGEKAADERLRFTMLQSMAFDGENNIYLLDSFKKQITKTDPNGQLVAKYETKDEAQFLEVDKHGNMYVVFSGNKVLFLNKEGVETTFTSSETIAEVIRLQSNGNILMGVSNPITGGQPENSLIGRFDDEFNRIGGLGERREYKTDRFALAGNSIAFTVDDNDYIYVTLITQNRVEKYSPDGELIWRADRPLNFEPEQLEGAGSFAMPLVSMQIDVDHKGRVWVTTFNRQMTLDEMKSAKLGDDLMSFHVFSPEGVFLGAVPATLFQNTQFIDGDRLFMIDLSEMKLEVYTIIG